MTKEEIYCNVMQGSERGDNERIRAYKMMQEYADQEVNAAKIKVQEMYMASMDQKDEQIKVLREALSNILEQADAYIIRTYGSLDFSHRAKDSQEVYLKGRAALNPPSSPE